MTESGVEVAGVDEMSVIYGSMYYSRKQASGRRVYVGFGLGALYHRIIMERRFVCLF